MKNLSGRAVVIVIFLSVLALLGLAGCGPAAKETAKNNGNAATQNTNANNAQNTNINGAVYPTYGVHNPPDDSTCTPPNCVYQRGPNDPPDPMYPEYWVSGWNMYRVYNKYSEYPPPYNPAPPPQLKEGVDYEKSWGKTYYDSTTFWPGGEGAMMEFYQARCLPIFPIPNNYTCAFISLGKIAYFVTYDKDRPAGMPPVCLFSGYNHPPRRNFIEHLPYSPGDSAQIGTGAQGYSFWIDPSQNGKPVQTGVNPIAPPTRTLCSAMALLPKMGK